VTANARGIDVSNFGGNFDWAATTGLSFGICRASQGLGAPGTNSPDPFLTWNWPRIKAKGLARGAYHFLDPRLDGAAQASYFVQTVSKVGLETTDMPAVLRVAIYDTRWHITNSVTVDSTKGQTVIPFPNPKSTGVISVKRMDAGEVVVGYEVSSAGMAVSFPAGS
jgi:hypothetical protein